MERIERIKIIGLPVDIVRPEEMEETLINMIEQPGTKQIFFLTIWDLLKAKVRPDFRVCLENASLILPVSKSIINGAKFLNKPIPSRYNPFRTLVSFLTILETRLKSVYLLGGHAEFLVQSEKNIRTTYKNLHIVGRVPGYFSNAKEKDILSAIFKANPSMVIIGDGIPSGARWVYERRNSFSSSSFIYYKDIFSIFSQKKKRLSDKTFEKGHEFWHELLRNPLKFFLVFPYIWYLLLILKNKIFNK